MKRLLIVSAAIVVAACNTRTPVLDNPVLTTAPSSFTSAGPLPVTTPVIDLSPAATIGGSSGRGTVRLGAPLAEGTVVALRASDPAVTVSPTQIEWPRNAFSIDFDYATPAVTSDRTLQIIVSTPERSAAAQLVLWPLAPMFFSYSGDAQAPRAGGRSGRLLPPGTQFTGRCTSNQLTIDMTPPQGSGETAWSLRMDTPSRVQLRPGVYDFPASNFFFTLGNVGSSTPANCTVRSRVTVRDVALTATGQIARFWATFEQSCTQTGATVRGDVRVANLPAPVNPFPGCNIQ